MKCNSWENKLKSKPRIWDANTCQERMMEYLDSSNWLPNQVLISRCPSSCLKNKTYLGVDLKRDPILENWGMWKLGFLSSLTAQPGRRVSSAWIGGEGSCVSLSPRVAGIPPWLLRGQPSLCCWTHIYKNINVWPFIVLLMEIANNKSSICATLESTQVNK